MAEPPKFIVIKKKVAAHGHHGGAWKVAYADFVTAMMALFIVLWLLSSADQQTLAQIAHYFREGVFDGSGAMVGEGGGSPEPAAALPAAMGGREARERLEQQVRDMLASEIGERLGALRDQVRIHSDAQGTWIEIVDSEEAMAFGIASATLSEPASILLTQLAPLLAATGHEIEVHGHTDARPYNRGSTRDNWDLSYIRARQGGRFLTNHGLDTGRLTAYVGHGASVPFTPDEPLAAANRRLSILVRAEDDS